MSTPDNANPKKAHTPHAKPLDAEAHHDDHGGAGHGTVKSYVIGFILSVILTAIPFGLTMAHMLPVGTLVPVIVAIGVVQILVHLYFFLHMNASSSQIWNNAAFVFTVLIVGILVVGSLWVMYHLNTNMMPGMMPVE
jgi:cytochrome o ubiquinol oxidase operon protein cyoD